jgi:hypothetical protein
MQHAHQVDHRVHALHQLRQRGFVMHVGLDRFHIGQRDQSARMHQPPGRQRDAAPLRGQLRNQPAANETGAAQHQHVAAIRSAQYVHQKGSPLSLPE